MSTEQSNLEIVQNYFAAIEQGAAAETMAAFFAPDVLQEEFPNKLTVNGAQRDLNALLEASVRGKKAISAQRYEIITAMVDGDRVALEVIWTGTLAVPLGSLPVGGEMRAHFAVFIDFRAGQIVGQRNYDCFDPF